MESAKKQISEPSKPSSWLGRERDGVLSLSLVPHLARFIRLPIVFALLFTPFCAIFSLLRSLVPGYSFPCSSKLYEIHYLNSQYKRIGPTNILKLPSHAPYKIQRHNNTLRTLFFVVWTVSYHFSFFPVVLWPTPLGHKSTGKNLVCK